MTGVTPLREFVKKVRHLEHEIEGRIVGVNPDFLKMTGQQTQEGRFLTDADMFYRANVAVLGSQAAEKLFPYGDPVGKTVRVGEEHYFRIIGVTTYQGPVIGNGQQPGRPGFQSRYLHPAYNKPGAVRRHYREREARELHG